jgi:hypothetical protein
MKRRPECRYPTARSDDRSASRPLPSALAGPVRASRRSFSLVAGFPTIPSRGSLCPEEIFLEIKVGCELIYDCPQPTPMMLVLHIHYSRAADIIVLDHITTTPSLPLSAYHDGFGNWCTRLVAPLERLRITSAALVRDSGRHRLTLRATAFDPGLAQGYPGFSAGEPILRHREIIGGGLEPVRKHAHGLGPGPGHLRLRAPPHLVRLRACPRHKNSLGGVQQAQRCLPRLRASCCRILPLPEHPGAILHRLSRRHGNASTVRSHGFCRVVRGLYRRALVHLRRTQTTCR